MAVREKPVPPVAVPALLAVEGLVLRYGPTLVLDGVTFAVGAGERVALVGPNGAGKTSVLDCVSGVVRPSSGRVLLRGRDLGRVAVAGRARLGVGRTLQHLGLVDGLDVIENLLLGRHASMRAGLVGAALRLPSVRREEAAQRARCQAVAAALGLAAEAASGVRVGALPAGARKRVELGRALVGEPDVLLLDEPFAGADAGEVALLSAAVRAAGEAGAAVVVVDHDRAAVTALCTRTVSLEDGRVAVAGTATAAAAAAAAAPPAPAFPPASAAAAAPPAGGRRRA